MEDKSKEHDVFANLPKADKQEEPEKKDVPNPIAEPKPEKSKKVKIIIEEQEGDENQGRVFVSVNGYPYSIKRGIAVDVPESVVHVLQTAIVTKIDMNPATGEENRKDVPRFNFRILDK